MCSFGGDHVQRGALKRGRDDFLSTSSGVSCRFREQESEDSFLCEIVDFFRQEFLARLLPIRPVPKEQGLWGVSVKLYLEARLRTPLVCPLTDEQWRSLLPLK
jgi:hypothetical protein